MSNENSIRFEPNPKGYMLKGDLLYCDVYCEDQEQEAAFEAMGLKSSKMHTSLWMDFVFDISDVLAVKMCGPVPGCDYINLTTVYFKCSAYDNMVLGIYFEDFIASWAEWKSIKKPKK
jgi:hypothetical protein